MIAVKEKISSRFAKGLRCVLKDNQQVTAPKRETTTFLKTLVVKFYVVAGGFALGELSR